MHVSSVALTLLLPVLAQAQSALYAQCGGTGFTGDMTCVSGACCVYSNDFYSQCVACTSSAATTTTTKTTTTKSSSTIKSSTTKTSTTSTKASSTTTTKSSTTSTAASTTTTKAATTTVAAAASCTVTAYTQASSAAKSCSVISIAAQTVPAGQSLAFSSLPDGTTIQLLGDISFGTGTYWTGNLFSLAGGNITFNGNGHTINGNGQWYWDGQGTNGGVNKPKYTVALTVSGLFQNVVVKNVPGHAFEVHNPAALTITGVTYDNSAGASLGHNTDAFDVSSSTDLTITGNTIINQDDCLAINDAKNVVFSNNSCTGGHGISIGSIKTGDVVDTVLIENNTVIGNQNGLRIKTYTNNDNASVSNVIYKDNTVSGCTDYGVIIVQDYTNTGETGTATAGIPITNVSFQGTNKVSTASGATMVKVLCYPGECTGTWDWSGLTTSGGKKGTNVGGAPITGYTF